MPTGTTRRAGTPMDEAQRFRLLQLNDALFPIGSFSHSYGLETYVAEGLLQDGRAAEAWLRAYIRHALLYNELLAVRLAHEAAEAGDLPQLLAYEELLYAARAPREIREALVRLGSRLTKTAQAAGLVEDDFFAAFVKAAGRRLSHPVCYGALTARLAIGRQEAVAHYAYAQISALVNTCVKLVPLAQTEGQRILGALQGAWAECVGMALEEPEASLGRSAPGLDIRSMQHETLYTRLYIS